MTKSSQSDNTALCSGSLISYQWVLTSATCIFHSNSFRLRFNTVTYYTGGNVQEQTTQEAYIHPHYDPINKRNDVALIRIAANNHVSYTIRLLPQSLDNSHLKDQFTLISGWGLTRSNDVSPVLQFGYGRINSNSHFNCINNWKGGEIHAEMLCATFYQQTSRSCAGDTGSPLAIRINRVWYQVGIAVFNANENICQNSTSLFTRISSVTDWIVNITGIKI